MKIYLRLEAPFEWVRINAKQVDAFGEVPALADYPIGEDDEVIGVVPGEWVTTHRVLLPAKTRKQFNAALPYALEESISEEVENMHFVCGNWKAGEHVTVSVVSKTKMLQWRELATEHRLPVQQLLPDHALIPFHEAADCTIALGDNSLLANHRDGQGVSIDPDFLEIWLMDIPIDATIAVNDESLTEQLIRDHADRDVRHWPFGSKMAHWLEYQPSVALDLWADKYKPKVRRAGKQSFLIPAAIFCVAVVLKLGYDSYQYVSMHNEIASIQQESQEILAARFPIFSDPEPGSERKLMEQAMARLGGPDRSNSMHSTLAEASKVLMNQRASLTNLVFRNDELILSALLNDFSQVDQITKQFNRKRTLDAQLQSSSSEDGKVVANYSIKRK